MFGRRDGLEYNPALDAQHDCHRLWLMRGFHKIVSKCIFYRLYYINN